MKQALYSSDKVNYIHVMRVLAVVAVVVQHVNGPILRYGLIGSSYWWFSNLVICFCSWDVPVFIILSGALLLEQTKDESIKQFYYKRFKRVGIPLLSWSAIYYAWSYYWGNPITKTIILNGLWEAKPYPHLYFLFLIMGLYAVTPLLRIYIKLTTKAAIDYFIIVSFILGLVYCYFAIFILNKTLVNSLNALNFFLPYLGYFIAGYRLKNFSENKRQRKYCLLFFVGTVLLGTLCTFFLAKKFGTTSPKGLYLYASLSPMVIVMSLAAFIILRRLSKKLLIMVPERMHSFIMHAARLSFGVYLIHPLIMDWLNRYIQQTGGYPNIWIAMPLFIVVVIFLSFLLCSVILKIPIVKNIID